MANTRGLRIGAFAGADIVVDQSIVFLIAYVVGTSVLGGGLAAAPGAFIFLGAILLAVLLHEMGHAATAAALNLRSKRIVLSFFGGHVEFERQPEKRWHEIAVSASGPVVNLLCAGLLPFLISWLSQFGWPSRDTPMALNLFDAFYYVSLMLGVFNLLPGFPLDGGRILSAALSYIMPRQRAYLIAAWTGLIVALCVVGFGAWRQYWWTLLIGGLLALTAWAEIKRASAALKAEPLAQDPPSSMSNA